MDMPLLCAGFTALSVTFYVLLDGFDLGVGALLLLQPHEKSRDHMVDSITPTWDGNGDSAQAAYGFLLGAVQEAMVTGRFRPELKDAQLLAQVLWASVHGVVTLHLSKPGGGRVEWRSADKAAQLATGMFLDGLLR